MRVKIKVMYVCLVLAFCCFFAANEALAGEVFYAPFEDYSLSPYTTTYLGPSLVPYTAFYYGGRDLVAGRVGKGAGFDGNRFLKIPGSQVNVETQDFAITFWVKTTSQKAYNTIIEKREPGSMAGYLVVLYNGRPLLQMNNGFGAWTNFYVPAWSAVNDGRWHYVAIYVDRNNVQGGKIYVDGESRLTFNPTPRAATLFSGSPLYIGRHATSSAHNFVGVLDELRIFISN